MEHSSKPYYFVSFMYGASEKTLEHLTIDIHPFVWQFECDKSYPGQYVLQNWKEISSTEYVIYNEVFNSEHESSHPVVRYVFGSKDDASSHPVVRYVFGSKDDASSVAGQLIEYVDKYGHVSVADYYDMIGEPPMYNDNAHGWIAEDIDKLTIVEYSIGYLIILPPTKDLTKLSKNINI